MLTPEQQIFEQIKKASNILITFKKTWSGDSIASALAFFLFLKKLNKNVKIAAEYSNQNQLYSFLPGYAEIKNSLDNLRKFIISLNIANTKISQIKYQQEENKLNFIISPKDGFFTPDDIECDSSGFKYDLIIIVDSPDLESLGKIYDNDTEFFYQTPIINIDHKSTNENFGQINLIELTAISTSEILFSLFKNFSNDLIDEDIATCLLTSIIAETKSFKTNNITPHTLSISSQLISIGARREEIVNKLYRSRNINVLKLWGYLLSRLSSNLNNQLIWSSLSHNNFIKTNCEDKDLTDIIDELIINIPQAKIIIIIYEKQTTENKLETHILIYSIKNINLLDLLKEFKPEGSKNLIKIKSDLSLPETEKNIIEIIEQKINKLSL